MDASGLYKGDHELFREKCEEIERMSLQEKLDLFAKDYLRKRIEKGGEALLIGYVRSPRGL